MTRHALALLVLAAAPAAAQRATLPALDVPPAPSVAPDTLHLGALHDAAIATDPHARQLDLQRARSALRLRNLAAERLPSFSADAQAQYQSDVTTIPIRLPNGQRVPGIPRDTYDAHLSASEVLLDPSLGARRAAERAQLAASQAEVHTALYAVHQQVNDAFFTAALLQMRERDLAAIITDLEAQLRATRARVQAGTALAGEAATLEAELLRRRQDEAALRADRGAALDVLASLTGRPIGDAVVLALPDLAGAVASARAAIDTLHRRPEYEQFARTRELAARQADVVAAATRPRVSAFGRLGYGRPGLDFLSGRFDTYWLAGIQVHWSPWDWGAAARERETYELQQRIVATEEAAFTRAIHRATTSDLATIDRLRAALATDSRIVALREQVERETRLRFDEGVVTAADYVARRTDVLDAQLARDMHRVELARSSARLLTTLGLEVR